MLKSLYPSVDWDRVRVVGFDLDGTLYDEAEFIAQVYRTIAAIIARSTGRPAEPIHAVLLRRWLEKGSSYDRIFGEALAASGVLDPAAGQAIDECVAAFRGFTPTLTLPARVQAILDAMIEKYPLFLISDGSAGLQQRKFAALGLGRWFEPANVGFSATRETGFAKPDTRILGEIRALRQGSAPAEVVFFGDREVDARFAASAGFHFVRVQCMYALTAAARERG
jgi:FMN phosphatase YigB (HAD superfamily)